MDPLTDLMVQRGLAPQPPSPSTPTTPGLPVVPPSGGQTHTPPQLQRFLTAQKMISAYRQNWTPNPILLQAAQPK